ncbi:uncharacterized protein SPPG_04853 [Spizellomyces punctatus DAOM BR117]|uniref:DUF155 domain-containing protein n=1 Tax=Spizellomyces punctatus (strain DAOM BR117) TaxID=645134 RepID=A0A0L0HI46_SPIPD|nr:uncharacterized protein SPPG_04853 [Spizellomyces punctatus DAOM BR117]KND00545.1 hypothetical protein SPPG_04853 [Spizellomyces punctatus DAOM BR117]|eukprot:XP_016608584.1 hypothetical protein SPPG_04853 [Spizellomyces punctatus DAOM BR117]
MASIKPRMLGGLKRLVCQSSQKAFSPSLRRACELHVQRPVQQRLSRAFTTSPIIRIGANPRVEDNRPSGPNWRAKKKKGVRDVGREESGQPSVVVPPMDEGMRATAYCTAENYNFTTLLPLLQRKYLLLPFIADDVYHIRLVNPSESISSSAGHDAEAFIFRDGTFATWGATDAQNAALLRLVKQVEINPYKEAETEWFHYCVDLDQAGGLTADTIIIGNSLPAHQARLAYSSGLARSVKLAALEEMLEKHLEKNRHIPQVLLQGKKLPLSRAAVLQNLGELFSLRGHLNLHGELLDSPDFCWSSAKMEDIFDRISRNLDVRPRIAVFNKKLDYANELTEVIRSHLHTKHSTGLEWGIIILIMIEVGFQVYHTYKEWEANNPSSRRSAPQVSPEFVPDEALEETVKPMLGKGEPRRRGEREREDIGHRREFRGEASEEDESGLTLAPALSGTSSRWRV